MPEGFQLQVEKRLQDRQAVKTPQEEEHKFKAQPLPKKILEGVVVSSGPLGVSVGLGSVGLYYFSLHPSSGAT